MFFKDKTPFKPGYCYSFYRFAWLPTRVDGGTVWLEFYEEVRRFVRTGDWILVGHYRSTK